MTEVNGFGFFPKEKENLSKKNEFYEEIQEKIELNKKRGLNKVCKTKSASKDLWTESDGSLLIYWYDAIEENILKDPSIILFGKVFNKKTSVFESISIIIKNLSRKVYVLPKIDKMNQSGVMESLKAEMDKLNQTKFSYLKNITYSVKKKKYCLDLPIPYSKFKHHLSRI